MNTLVQKSNIHSLIENGLEIMPGSVTHYTDGGFETISCGKVGSFLNQLIR